MNDGTEEEFGPGDVGYLSACAIAVTCHEGSTTVTPPTPPSTCVPPTIGGQTATPTDDTCTATLPTGAPLQQFVAFIRECQRIPDSTLSPSFTCTFPAT